MMETALMKKIGFKVVRKLKIVRAYVPQRKLAEADIRREIGADRLPGVLQRCPQVFQGSIDQKSLQILQREFPLDWNRTIEVARNALRHRFNLLGSGLVDLGPNIDWCTDFKSGKTWDKRDFRLQKLVNLNDDSDVKIPWELSRCNHFLPMALVCLLENDESYLIEFENQVISWSEQNEYLQTVNWSCPMDTAIRCLNWLLAYQLLSSRHQFGKDFISLLTIELYKGGKSIFENLEKTGDGHNTNHYLTNLLGLLYLGELFNDAARPNIWREFAISEFEKEMTSQVSSDGLDYESSLPYHGLVTEIFLLAQMLSARSDFAFSSNFELTLSKMLANLCRFSGADGLVENFGDNDDGRILKLFSRPARDFRDVIDVGMTVMSSRDFPPVAATPERIVMANRPSNSLQSDVAAWQSIHLPESGLCQLRSSDLVVNFFANQVGTAGLGNHKHNDLLSLTLAYKGAPILVDPGTFVYSVDENLRNQFRSTRSHNTVMVDDCEQNRMVNGLLFLLRSDGTPRILDWHSTAMNDLVIAEHDCYGRLDEPVTHRRSLYLSKSNQILLIRDELLGAGVHKLEFNFHINRMKLETLENHLVQMLPTDSPTGLLFANCDASSRFQVDSGWVSPSYGVRYPSIVLSQKQTSNLPFTALFAAAPNATNDASRALLEIEALRHELQW